MTASPVRGLLLGMVITAVIQSSGATTVMAVGFVNSGLMELHQAIGVIMGANIGTTVTGWLLSLSGLEGDSFAIQMLNPNAWAPILGFIGIFLYMLGKDKDRRSGVGKIMVGFSVLMAGMNTMSTAMSPLADEPWFMDLFLSFKNPVLGVLAGAVLTAVLQSSSASVGILQALTSTGAVTYAAAVPIIMGQNIGTTVTALISSAGANKMLSAPHLFICTLTSSARWCSCAVFTGCMRCWDSRSTTKPPTPLALPLCTRYSTL